MAVETRDKRLTNNEFNNLSAFIELDLMALFSQWRDDSIKLLTKIAIDKEWTEERFLKEIDNLVDKGIKPFSK